MGTIADKLSYLNDTKIAIKDAIISKGVEIAETDTFRSYAEKIAAISANSSDYSIEDALLTGTLTTYSNDRITTLRPYALMSYSNLETVSLPNVETIGEGALSQTGLTHIELPKTTELGTMAMSVCMNLTDVYLNVATSIGAQCFYDCTELTSLSIQTPTMCTLGAVNALSGTKIADGKGYIYVPVTLIDTYKSDPVWSNYAERIVALAE